MAKYLLVDTMNAFMRAKMMAPMRADTWTKIGFSLHITLSMVNKSWNKEAPDHIVFCLEGRSWRKDVYEPYKRNRKVARDKVANTAQGDEDAEIMAAFDDFCTFLDKRSNCSVLRHPGAEADDVIARWIHAHPNDEHIILSSDSDFVQLLAPNVHIYNGVKNELTTLDGVYNDKGALVLDKKTKEPLAPPDPAWELFLKIVRGDTSDNIFSAYPKAPVKSSSKRIGIREAYEDTGKGYSWNNFMLQKWTDHTGTEHRVLDDFARNEQLIDLTAQPDHIKEMVDEVITAAQTPRKNPHVGRYFLQFCGKYDLRKVADFAKTYTAWLNKSYGSTG